MWTSEAPPAAAASTLVSSTITSSAFVAFKFLQPFKGVFHAFRCRMYVPLGDGHAAMGGNLHDRECIGTSFPQAGQRRVAQRMPNKLLGPFQRNIAHLLMLMVNRRFQGSARVGSPLERPRVIFVVLTYWFYVYLGVATVASPIPIQ